MEEQKKQFYIDLCFVELIKQYEENIKGKTQKHLEVYLTEGYKDCFFWNYVTKISKQEKNVDFETFIGDEFMIYLHKKVGSKKRSGMWDFKVIWEYLNNFSKF
jgi:hypothetical protein